MKSTLCGVCVCVCMCLYKIFKCSTKNKRFSLSDDIGDKG